MSDQDSDTRPLTSLQSVILMTGPFIFFWSTLRGYVSRNGPFRHARTITRLNSQLYAVFSLALAGLILRDYLENTTHSHSHYNMPFLQETLELLVPPFAKDLRTADLAHMYHVSKFYEYVDVFNLVGQGTAIGPHMAFHHLTTPFYTYFRVLNASQWQVFAFCNCVHHFFMYAYFGGVGLFRPILPVTGWIQLAAGIAVDVFYCVSEGKEAPETRNRAIGIMILARYAMLFYEELKGSAAKKGSAAGGEVKSGKEE